MVVWDCAQLVNLPRFLVAVFCDFPSVWFWQINILYCFRKDHALGLIISHTWFRRRRSGHRGPNRRQGSARGPDRQGPNRLEPIWTILSRVKVSLVTVGRNCTYVVQFLKRPVRWKIPTSRLFCIIQKYKLKTNQSCHEIKTQDWHCFLWRRLLGNLLCGSGLLHLLICPGASSTEDRRHLCRWTS